MGTLQETLEQQWTLPDEDFPPFTKFDELLTIEALQEKVDLSRNELIKARYGKPPLPFIRLGKRIFFAEPQVIWWLNMRQRTIPDTYSGAARRRMTSGFQKQFQKRAPNAKPVQARKE